MYDVHYLGLAEIMKFLGTGRNTTLRLCQERPYNFPVVRIGRKYQADAQLLDSWRRDWYSGKFDIN